MRPLSAQPTGARRAILLLLAVAACLSSAPRALAATACTAADFACPTSGTCVISGAWDVGNACTLDFGSRDVRLTGTLRTSERSGRFAIVAGGLTIDGGQIDLRGDRVAYGGELDVALSGPFVMQGTNTRIAGAGNAGGAFVTIVSQGAVLASGVISVDGGIGEACGDAGYFALDAGSGTLRVENTIRARSGGRDCVGGEIGLVASRVEIAGILDASGGAFASEAAILIGAVDGDLTVTKDARLRADGTGQYDGIGAIGGDFLLYATGNIDLAAPISSRARGWQGLAGNVFVSADGSVDVSGDVRLTARGGSGGAFLLGAGGPVRVRSTIDSSGSSRPQAYGGTIQIRSEQELSVTGKLDTSGREAAQLYLGGNPVSMTGSIVARATVGAGYVDIAGCNATIGGTIDARGKKPGVDGAVAVYAAAAQVTSSARILSGEGPCSFTSNASCVELTTRSGGLDIMAGAVIDPQPTTSIDDLLPACPVP